MESDVAKGMALTTNVHFTNSAATCSLLTRDVHSAADEQLGILNADCMKSEGVHKSKRICRSVRHSILKEEGRIKTRQPS
jgi:hypothetical protein